MTQDLNRKDILETACALEALGEFLPNDEIESSYITIASRIAGGLAINYIGQPTQGSKHEFARTVIELTNALCAEMGDRAPNPEDIANEE